MSLHEIQEAPQDKVDEERKEVVAHSEHDLDARPPVKNRRGVRTPSTSLCRVFSRLSDDV